MSEVPRFYPKRHQPTFEKPAPGKPAKLPVLRTMEERLAGILQSHKANAALLDGVKAGAVERDRKAARDYMKERLQRDPLFKLLHGLRSRLRNALKWKGHKKCAPTVRLLGCSIAHLKEHLFAQFKPGLTWENHGAWEIDHIRPCASFDFSKAQHQRECFHYSNLQPLWKAENRDKRAKWTPNL